MMGAMAGLPPLDPPMQAVGQRLALTAAQSNEAQSHELGQLYADGWEAQCCAEPTAAATAIAQ